ncbi:hypothetical protein GTO89_07200 [Heliobacterium gestii]|uniref:PRC-barrel domain-containing protein n=1 Tax=Heliomicrobium gestii TaxID=2699 RepID=A0A845LBX1_HELGE|nr:PRC-barrel domain-containing protein [Heliomicrobium gestii]MBM7866391.1 uncharacterized protein YrrD [Heliomicrobium gestii]MZP42824.1 hypothetical protein [Heliomicrobium gestii]
MLASKSLLTRPIVSLDEGQKLGTVRGLVVDPEALEVVALQVDQKGLFREQKIIPYTKVHSIGDDAIVIDRSSQVQRATNLPHLFELIKSKTVIIGSKVLTTLGQKIGLVEEYYFDRRTGKLLTIEIRGHFGEGWFNNRALLPASAIRTISAVMVLIYEDALDQLTPVESAFEGTVKKVSEQSERFWSSTVGLSKEWGAAIGRAIGLDERKKTTEDGESDVNPWKTPEYAGPYPPLPTEPAPAAQPAGRIPTEVATTPPPISGDAAGGSAAGLPPSPSEAALSEDAASKTPGKALPRASTFTPASAALPSEATPSAPLPDGDTAPLPPPVVPERPDIAPSSEASPAPSAAANAPRYESQAIQEVAATSDIRGLSSPPTDDRPVSPSPVNDAKEP